jgi:hypothetical protein
VYIRYCTLLRTELQPPIGNERKKVTIRPENSNQLTSATEFHPPFEGIPGDREQLDLDPLAPLLQTSTAAGAEGHSKLPTLSGREEPSGTRVATFVGSVAGREQHDYRANGQTIDADGLCRFGHPVVARAVLNSALSDHIVHEVAGRQ